MPTPVTLQIRADTRPAAEEVRKLNEAVSAAFDAIREKVAGLNAQMRELVFSPENILRGTDQAAKGIRSVTAAAEGAEKSLADLQGTSKAAESGLKSVGTSAGSASKKLTDLSGTSGAVDAALEGMAAAAGKADTALLSLDDGAASAQKSVAGMGRAAASALARIDSLSGAAFDPAGVVAGSDVAAAALGRVKLAAGEAKTAMLGAGRGAPVFLGGGGRRGSIAEGERPMTFGGGLRAGAGAAIDIGGAAAMVTTIAAALSGKLAISFDNMMQGVKGNTTMSDADAADMRRLTLQLMRTGSPDEQIAKAYMHVQNFAYKGKDAASIVTEGNKMGIATHSPVEDTGRILAATLREYNLPAAMSRQMAETLHLTSASGDMYLKEFDKYAGKAFATGAADKVTAPEIAAALSAITQHGIAIPKASTQVTGMLKQIVNPTKKGKDEADSLGIGDDFTPQGLLKKQLSGVMKDVMRVTGGDAGKIGTLFNGMQGGLGAKILTGMGAGTYNTALNDPKTGTKAAFAGKTNAIDPLYNQQMKQTQQAFAALSGEIKSDFIPIGEKVGPLFTAAIPVVRAVAGAIKTLLTGFTELPKPVQEAVLAVGGLALLSKFLPLLGGFSLLSEKTSVVLGGLAKALLGGGAAAEAGAAGIAGMALPLVAAAAAVAAFALAWKSDFGHIREVTAKVCAEVSGFVSSQFGQVKAWFTKNMPEIRETVHTVLSAIQQFWHDHGARIMGIIGPLWNFIKDTVVNALHLIENVVKLAMDIINGHWAAAGRDLLGIVGNLWKELDSLFENGGALIDNALMLVIETVLDFGKRLFEGMLNAGQQAINGIVGGIKGGIGKVASAAKGLAAAVPSAVTGFLDIHSPSRVMHKLGLNTAEGLAQGIRDGKISVDAASKLLATSPAAIVRQAITEARRGQAAGKKRAAQVQTAGDYAATVGETPEEKELHKLGELRAKGLINAQAYSEAYARIKATGNKASEKEAARHVGALQQIEDGLKAFTKTPETPSLDRQEAAAHAQYRRQVKDLTDGSPAPYSAVQRQGVKDAGTLLGDKLGAINAQRSAIAQKAKDKASAEAQSAQEAADSQVKQSLEATTQLQRELWQHAGGDMQAYFASLRTEAEAALKDVQDKFGPKSTHPNAPAVAAAQTEHDTRLLDIKQQETDTTNQLADQRTQHDLEQGKISQAQYVAYLTQRRDAYAQYSQEWLTLDSQLYAADTELQRKQLQALEDLFTQHKISLEQYKKLLGQLAIPVSSPVYHDVQEAAAGAQNKANRQMVGGDDFWGSLVNSASENGSKLLTALLHPKDKKKIFKSMWTDLMGSLEGGVTQQFSNILKNLITGVFTPSASGRSSFGGLPSGAGASPGAGTNIAGLFGGLFGGGASGSAAAAPGGSASGAGGDMISGGMGAMLSMIPGLGGLGGLGGLLPGLLGSAGSFSPQGINGPVGGIGGLLGSAGGAGGIQGLTGMLTGAPGQGGPLGGLTSLLPMLGHGGLLSGMLGHGGMAGLLGHGMMSVLPWVGGGILLNKILGNPLGKLFKHFHLFAQGGIVPGHGNHDSVPSFLTPGEMVLPKGISKMLMQVAMPQVPAMPSTLAGARAGVSPQGTTTARTGQTSGSVSAEIHNWGDNHYHYEADADRTNRRMAKTMEDALRSGIPA